MIITAKKQIPQTWIYFTALPAMLGCFATQVMGAPFLFSLQKYVSNPAALTFILSLPGWLALIICPVTNFVSDRIWTRFGRRKPFVVTAQVGMMVVLFLIPLAPNLWFLVALLFAYNVFVDLAEPGGPLGLEIVPPHQRGRSAGITSWGVNLANMTYYFVVLGRFDDVRFMAGVPMAGEKLLFWIAGLTIAIMILYLTLAIKEVDQKSPLRGQRLSVRTFFGGIMDRELWPVYTLIFGMAVLNSGLGPLGALLYTEQWQYSKQLMGTNVFIGGVLNIFIIGFLTVIADRLNRLRAYQVLIITALALKIFYYVYVTYLIPDQRPSLVELVVFGEALSIVGTLLAMIYGPMVYDYVVRNKMGTYNAGAGLLSRIVGMLTMNGIGLFVWAYTVNFQPPAGEMTRVVFQEEWKKSDVTGFINAASWTDPERGTPVPASAVHAHAWYRTGLVSDSGHCWEIRLKDKDSERLAEKKTELDKESSPIIGSEKMQRDKAAALKLQNKTEAAAREERAADVNKARIDELTAKMRAIDATLADRAKKFQAQVARNLSERIMTDGNQILATHLRDALVVELPTTKRPSGARLERILTDLRRERPDVIDLRPIKRDATYGVAISALLEPGADENRIARDLQSAFTRIATTRDPALVRTGADAFGRSRRPAVVMKLKIIEEPLDTRIAPITRVVNAILALIDKAPSPDQRLTAMARTLRVVGETDHVRVDAGTGNAKTISVVALLGPEAAKSTATDDPEILRFRNLLVASPNPDAAAQARALYNRIETAAGAQRLTIAQPFIAVAFAPMKYNYLVGYLATFLLAGIGLMIVFSFIRRVKRGEVHMLGVEEEHAEKRSSEAAADVSDGGPGVGERAYYTPGYAKVKLGMIVFGLAVFAGGLTQLGTPLRLLVVGHNTAAEATRVFKTRTGTPDLVFTDDVQLREKEESRDRSYTFWNEFRFQTAEGREVTVRAPVGSQLKPLYPLIDEDGLPTSVPIRYDPRHPETAIFPTIFSTWYAPGAVTLLGLLCAVTGSFLLYWANKPIELPYIASQPCAPESNPPGTN